MLVSSFGISGDQPGSTALRSTESRYWLELTNLSSQDITFEFAAHVTRYSSLPPSRSADRSRNTTGGTQAAGGRRISGDYYTWYEGGWSLEGGHPVLRLSVPASANSSQPVRLSASSVNRTPRVEGYVELTVPVIRSATAPFSGYRSPTGPSRYCCIRRPRSRPGKAEGRSPLPGSRFRWPTVRPTTRFLRTPNSAPGRSLSAICWSATPPSWRTGRRRRPTRRSRREGSGGHAHRLGQ